MRSLSVLAALAALSTTPSFAGAASYGPLESMTSFEAVEAFKDQFDMICGDTFCEGEFSNLQFMGFDCAIEMTTKKVGQCLWTMSGSYADVVPATGKIKLTKKFFACDLHFKGNEADLEAFLAKASKGGDSGFQGLWEVTIPGTTKTMLDVISDCL